MNAKAILFCAATLKERRSLICHAQARAVPGVLGRELLGTRGNASGLLPLASMGEGSPKNTNLRRGSLRWTATATSFRATITGKIRSKQLLKRLDSRRPMTWRRQSSHQSRLETMLLFSLAKVVAQG